MTSRFARPPDPPLTLGEVNQRLLLLNDELERQHKDLEDLLTEQQQVTLAYEMRYAAAISTSEQKSEDRRKAEATAAMAHEFLDDDDTDLATRRGVLDMRVRAQREYAHNIRAEINAMQTLSANLRAEAGLAAQVRP